MPLCSDTLDAVLHEACRLVAAALGVDLAKVLEIDVDGLGLLVRAGVGWRPGVVGRKRIRMTERSSETHAIEAGRPVLSEDTASETRFEFADFLKEHGVAALVNVPIPLPGGKPYGLLQVDSRMPRAFDQDDVEFLRTYAAILGPVIDRLHKAHSLEEALRANRGLPQELQHRVKNHLATIAGFVRLRATQARSQETREELAGLGDRIETLRLAHEELYAAGVTDRLPLRPFLTRLVEGVYRLNAERSGDMRLVFDITDVEANPEVAVPLGLIVNEFVQNSLTHAFEGRGGTPTVALARDTSGRLRLATRDDGRGLIADAPAAKRGSGTGVQLINGLARQLGATAFWSSAEPGTALGLEFNKRG
jgi:two-component sensor histidine kinase